MQGKIIKGIAGFYYVQTEDKLYECKAKGIFRNKKMKPLVGDNVEIDILDEAEQEGNITKIYERHNELIRPAVSNDNVIQLINKTLISFFYLRFHLVFCIHKKVRKFLLCKFCNLFSNLFRTNRLV